jgi:hypothetical protein
MTTSVLSGPTPVTAGQPPRLLDQIAAAARHRGASEPTTARLVSWVRAYILFHGKRHPAISTLRARRKVVAFDVFLADIGSHAKNEWTQRDKHERNEEERADGGT